VTAADVRAYAAEAVGTFLLVFAGPGAVVIDGVSGGSVTHLGIGLSFGLAVMAAIFAVGHISGAHINPAVTLAFALAGHFPRRHALPYIAAQLAGAAAAALVLRWLFGRVADLGATVPSDGAGQALGLEVVITALLMLVIMAVATDLRAVQDAAALAIGGYVALAATFSGPIAGASMNPARSFGPALLSGTWTDHWVYWVGPIAGAAVGAAVYVLIRDGKPPGDDHGDGEEPSEGLDLDRALGR
jgi:MIP family channel proteins